MKDTERYPLHAAEIVLIGVVPCDQNTEWPEIPCKLIQKGLLAIHNQNKFNENFSTEETDEYNDPVNIPEEVEKRDTICRSKCAMILGNTIWAKQVQLLEKLHSHDIDAEGKITHHYSSNWTPIFEVKERLMRKGLAEENPNHISDLLQICKTANLPTKVAEKLAVLSYNLVNGNKQLCDSSYKAKSQAPSITSLDKGKDINASSSGFDCPLDIKKLHQKTISEIITFHQVAHLKLDPEIDEISDSGLPNEEELKKHSQKTDISVPDLRTKFRYLKLQKYIENNCENNVLITFAYDPSCFYLRNTKFTKQLLSLENDIHEYAEQAKIVHSANAVEFKEGQLCIGRQLAGSNQDSGIYSVNAEIQGGKDTFEYKRVQILRIATEEDEAFDRDPMSNFRYLDSGDENDTDGYSSEDDIRIATTKYAVFYVDYGYQKVLRSHDLLPIPKKFVERLPLQAIGCSLSNIVPSPRDSSLWSKDSIDFINEFASIKSSFVEGERRFISAKSVVQLKAINVMKCDYYEESSEPDNWPIRYWVKLVPMEGGDHLSMQLIKQGFAENDDYSEIMLSYNENDLKNFNSTKEMNKTNQDNENNSSHLNRIPEFQETSVRNITARDNIPKAIVTPVQKSLVTIPASLPGLCFSEMCGKNVEADLRPQLITWSQNKEKTNIVFRFQIGLIYSLETCRNNTFLSIKSRSLDFEYLEVGYMTDNVENYRHYSIPMIHLYGAVDPQKTEVKFSGKEIIIKLSKINCCFWKYPTIDPESGKGKKVTWIKLDSDIGWPGSSDDSENDSDSGRKPLGPESTKRKVNSKFASKIRYTLDQYPSPLNANVEAKNFDDSTDGVEDFAPFDQNQPTIESEDTDTDGKNQIKNWCY